VIRQLPLTVTDQVPLRSPLSSCNRGPGSAISPGATNLIGYTYQDVEQLVGRTSKAALIVPVKADAMA
jgi:hypothetical protein